MSEFKVGDRVRVRSGYMTLQAGDAGTVVETCDTGFGQCSKVETDDGRTSYPLSTRLEKVEPEPQFKKGDRVRVTFEDEVSLVAGDRIHLANRHEEEDFYFSPLDENVVAVEKIEPPVEAFGPGDFVRSKAVPDYMYLVLRDGYVDLYNSIYNSHNTSEFNSLHYERVTLVEPPL